MSSIAVANILNKNKVEKLGYLPCGQLKWLLANLSPEISRWHLTRESAGVALSFGWAMGGRRAALLIQSTGVGTLITELMTLPVLYKLPLPLLVSWRGHYKEAIEAQTIFGERLVPMLEALDIPVTIIESSDDLEALDSGIARCYDASQLEVFLLSPQLWVGEKQLENPTTGHPNLSAINVKEDEYKGWAELTRHGAIQTILATVNDETVVIPQIGYPAREAYAIKDRDRNLYLLGALGSATLVGIGLAEARPDLEVIVLDGDGAFLIHPNQMLELSQSCPKNLTVVILDNGAWGSTGSQPTLTSSGLNLPAMGAAVGTQKWFRVTTPAEWDEARERGKQLIHFLIQSGNAKVGTIPLTAFEIKSRVLQATGRPRKNLEGN
jgi:sulfopyruvate decarboxylase subunit beta